MSNAVLVGLFTAGTVAVGAGGYVLYQRMQVTSIPDQAAAIQVTEPTAEPVAVAVARTPDRSPDVGATAPEAALSAQTAPATPDLPMAPRLPTLDLVRVDANGAAVVAGSGPATADVVLRLDGQEVATTRTDGSGNFVSLFDVPLGDAPRILTLETVTKDDPPLRAAESVIVAPTSPAPPAMAEAQTSLPDQVGDRADPPVEMAAVAPEAPGAPAIVDAQVPSGEPSVPTQLPETDKFPDATVADGDGVDNPGMDAEAPAPVASEAAPVSDSLVSPDTPSAPSPPTRPGATLSETTVAATDIAPAQGRQPSGLSAADTTRPPSVPPVPATTADPTLRPANPQPSAAPSLAAVTAPRNVERPTAPRLFRAGPAGISVVSDGPGALPVANVDLGIDAIAYDAIGDVRLTGTGQRDAQLRIYLDNKPVQTVRVDDTGAWTSPLPNVDSGVYTLRIDEVSLDGTVQSRIETPFQRTAPEIAAQLRRDGATAITVQPGYTLWAISEGYFGNGVQYVQLFEANRDQIRDPDLIYPGQVFALPTE
ncbi:LysM peptidoglycan-binding domain-containing protein [Jannaschia sp. 2305UL9-9]|uniref:LysM peptidoglycan-binding domain-containing protein n=1 Tax=Jannaschia sp. 2305UL9-9 TaxID=3121638 RepID=UPI0035298B43